MEQGQPMILKEYYIFWKSQQKLAWEIVKYKLLKKNRWSARDCHIWKASCIQRINEQPPQAKKVCKVSLVCKTLRKKSLNLNRKNLKPIHSNASGENCLLLSSHDYIYSTSNLSINKPHSRASKANTPAKLNSLEIEFELVFWKIWESVQQSSTNTALKSVLLVQWYLCIHSKHGCDHQLLHPSLLINRRK